MTKISSRKYAKALWQLAQGKSKPEIDQLAQDFILLLQKNNDLNQANDIISSLDDIANQSAKRLDVTITSPKPLSSAEQNLISKKLKNKTGYRTILINNQIEPELIAGWQLKIGWQKLDNSLRAKLNHLKLNLE